MNQERLSHCWVKSPSQIPSFPHPYSNALMTLWLTGQRMRGSTWEPEKPGIGYELSVCILIRHCLPEELDSQQSKVNLDVNTCWVCRVLLWGDIPHLPQLATDSTLPLGGNVEIGISVLPYVTVPSGTLAADLLTCSFDCFLSTLATLQNAPMTLSKTCESLSFKMV